MANIKKGAETLWDLLTKQGMDADTAKKVASGELPPELASQRMLEQGYTPDWYHGSTHDVTNYDASVTNPESDWGQGIYLSNTPEDVAANYATEEGADLTQRIQLLSEQQEIPFEEAKKIIAGQTKGITYPSAIDESEFAQVGGATPTWLDDLGEDYAATARKELDPKDYDTTEDFEDAVTEYADDLRYDDVNSPEQMLSDTMTKYGVDTSSMPHIDFTQTNTIEDLRDLLSGFEFYDAEDNIVGSGAVVADWLKQLGYKGILDHNVNKRFGSERKFGQPMEGMDYDTVHAIVFPEHEGVIRSQYGAAFDPEKKGKGGMLNAIAPLAVGTAGAGTLGSMLFGSPMAEAGMTPKVKQALESVVARQQELRAQGEQYAQALKKPNKPAMEAREALRQVDPKAAQELEELSFASTWAKGTKNEAKALADLQKVKNRHGLPAVLGATVGSHVLGEDAQAAQPLGVSTAGIKTDPYAITDTLGSIITGAKQGLARTFTPEGFLAANLQALGVPEAGRMREEIARAKVPDYKTEGEMSQEARTLWQLLGNISADPSPF